MKFGPQILALLCVTALNVMNTHADNFTAATSSESPEYHIHAVFLGADGQIALEIQPEERPNSKSINLLSDQKLMFCDEWMNDFSSVESHHNASKSPALFRDLLDFLRNKVVGEVFCTQSNPDLDRMLSELGTLQNETTTVAAQSGTTCALSTGDSSISSKLDTCRGEMKRGNGAFSVNCVGSCISSWNIVRVCIEKSRKHHRCVCPFSKDSKTPPNPCDCNSKCSSEATFFGAKLYKASSACQRFYMSIPECKCVIDLSQCE